MKTKRACEMCKKKFQPGLMYCYSLNGKMIYYCQDCMRKRRNKNDPSGNR